MIHVDDKQRRHLTVFKEYRRRLLTCFQEFEFVCDFRELLVEFGYLCKRVCFLCRQRRQLLLRVFVRSRVRKQIEIQFERNL